MNYQKVLVNTRNLSSNISGVQRYTTELVKRMKVNLEPVFPTKSLSGISGHIWEQIYLPMQVGKNLLWSPSNSGPLTVSRQVITIHDMATLDNPKDFSPLFVIM